MTYCYIINACRRPLPGVSTTLPSRQSFASLGSADSEAKRPFRICVAMNISILANGGRGKEINMTPLAEYTSQMFANRDIMKGEELMCKFMRRARCYASYLMLISCALCSYLMLIHACMYYAPYSYTTDHILSVLLQQMIIISIQPHGMQSDLVVILLLIPGGIISLRSILNIDESKSKYIAFLYMNILIPWQPLTKGLTEWSQYTYKLYFC